MKLYAVIATVFVLSGCAPWLMQEHDQFTKQQIECHYEVPTGSHLKQRVCMTVAESAELSRKSREALQEAQLRRQAELQLQRGGRRPEGP